MDEHPQRPRIPDLLRRPEWFAREAAGSTASPTRRGCLIWTQIIATRRQMTEDAAVLAWAAAIHDMQRHDDGSGPQHGTRAVAWTRTNLPALAPGVAAEQVAFSATGIFLAITLRRK